jgi:hypothetical protein
MFGAMMESLKANNVIINVYPLLFHVLIVKSEKGELWCQVSCFVSTNHPHTDTRHVIVFPVLVTSHTLTNRCTVGPVSFPFTLQHRVESYTRVGSWRLSCVESTMEVLRIATFLTLNDVLLSRVSLLTRHLM